MVAHACGPSTPTTAKQVGQSPEAQRPPSPTYIAAKDETLSQTRWKVRTNIHCCPLTFRWGLWHTHLHPHRCTTRTYIHVHIYICMDVYICACGVPVCPNPGPPGPNGICMLSKSSSSPVGTTNYSCIPQMALEPVICMLQSTHYVYSWTLR